MSHAYDKAFDLLGFDLSLRSQIHYHYIIYRICIYFSFNIINYYLNYYILIFYYSFIKVYLIWYFTGVSFFISWILIEDIFNVEGAHWSIYYMTIYEKLYFPCLILKMQLKLIECCWIFQRAVNITSKLVRIGQYRVYQFEDEKFKALQYHKECGRTIVSRHLITLRIVKK